MPRAAIDVGSNSILLTLVDDTGQVITDRAEVVGLGRGLGDRGLFRPDRMEAAEEVLRTYVDMASQHGIHPWSIRAVATSAARRAMNAATFFQRLQRDLGLKVRIISGDEEARLTWVGALRDLDLPEGPLLVVDLGGGSTELVCGTRVATTTRVSLEVGSVRLTEAFLGTDVVDPADLARARKHVDGLVRGVSLRPTPRTVVGVAGTVTTLRAMQAGLTRYDAEAVHGGRITRSELATLVDRLLPATPEERRTMVPVAPDRADYLLAGALILDRVLGVARRPSLVVSDRGLRFGLLHAGTA
jgi:exopolyphosphatase / guanosine-5'-triphosphate,3'-diphosphate pyrophosphatase